MRVDRNFEAGCHGGDAQRFRDATAFGQIRLPNADHIIFQHTGEFKAGEVILASGKRRAAKTMSLGIGTVIMRGEGFFQPADIQPVHLRHHLPHLRDIVANIGVGQDFQIMAKGIAHRFHAGNIIAHRIAHAKLHRLVSRFHMGRRFIKQLRGRLIAKCHTTGIGRHGTGRATEQLVQRQVQRLALGIP